ncbi:hypothetical protein BYI23_D009600 (plasmid) [Burkholderia sp. YI23]|nr:hypothetical protein BYI23_D009600 [Burkholderia sp. YI23]
MDTQCRTFGWEHAKNGAMLLKLLGEYPSFHDSAVDSFLMQRVRSSNVSRDGKPLFPGCERNMVDLTLEILHNKYGPRREPDTPDYAVVVKLLDVRTGEIDINAMLDEAWIRDIELTKEPSGLIKFDLNPNIGLDIVLTCSEVLIESIRPYHR